MNAVIAAPFRLVSDQATFYAVRALGLLELLVLTAVVWRLLRLAVPGRPHVAAAGAAVIGLNPMLQAMSTSVQNDTLALVFGFSCLLVLGQPGGRHSVVPGSWGCLLPQRY